MIIEIDKKTKIRVHGNCYALMKKIKQKQKFVWKEYRWFTKMDNLIANIVQERLSRHDTVVSLKDFIKYYKRDIEELKSFVNAKMN